MKKLIRDLHEGKDLAKNLKEYRTLTTSVYREYAALDLTFSAFMMVQEIMEEYGDELPEEESRMAALVLAIVGQLGKGECDCGETVEKLQEIRREITGKMDVFTACTDRLLCYEYVMNRMELQYIPEKELKEKLSSFQEEEFMELLKGYLFSERDQSVLQDKLRLIVGELPVHMTRGKLFEKIAGALSLYKDGDKNNLDSFLYMIRTSAMVYEPGDVSGVYPRLGEMVKELEAADYENMPEEEYDRLASILEEAARYLQEQTNFYYNLQKVVNGIYAVCLILPYCKEEKQLEKACRSIWVCLAQKEYRDEMLQPLEGRIEEKVEQTSYLESVLFEIKLSYKEELEKLEMTDFIQDFSLVANLLSDSLFIDLDRVTEIEKAGDVYVRQVTEELLEELSAKMAQVSRPVKRAIMAKILQKLPLEFSRQEQVEEYIRVNLFGCQDRAQKCVVMMILKDLIWEYNR